MFLGDEKYCNPTHIALWINLVPLAYQPPQQHHVTCKCFFFFFNTLRRKTKTLLWIVTLLLLITVNSKGRREGQADSNQRFIRFRVRKKGPSNTRVIRLQLDMYALNSYECPAKCVLWGEKISCTTCSVDYNSALDSLISLLRSL